MRVDVKAGIILKLREKPLDKKHKVPRKKNSPCFRNDIEIIT